MVTLAIISRSDGIAVQRDEEIEKQEIKELFFKDQPNSYVANTINHFTLVNYDSSVVI